MSAGFQFWVILSITGTSGVPVEGSSSGNAGAMLPVSPGAVLCPSCVHFDINFPGFGCFYALTVFNQRFGSI